jgi:hypothetical protein
MDGLWRLLALVCLLPLLLLLWTCGPRGSWRDGARGERQLEEGGRRAGGPAAGEAAEYRRRARQAGLVCRARQVEIRRAVARRAAFSPAGAGPPTVAVSRTEPFFWCKVGA